MLVSARAFALAIYGQEGLLRLLTIDTTRRYQGTGYLPGHAASVSDVLTETVNDVLRPYRRIGRTGTVDRASPVTSNRRPVMLSGSILMKCGFGAECHG